MAISYVSKTYSSDGYTIPLDINLLGKVLSIKQEKFDQNAQLIQQGINQIGNTDIIKVQDKEYINGKINKLVDGINSLGGIDLSDINNYNQIQSMGTDIYNDDKVINAISGTKSIRALQDGYKEYKTNPKLSKLYSVANEYNDNLSVNSYLSDPNVGSSYNGPSSPTPYVPYKDNLIKNINGVKANLKQTYTPDGQLIYVNEKNEEISPERIIQMAKDLSTADEVAQMGRDGIYQFRNLDSAGLVNKAIELNNQKLTNATATLQRYKSLYLQATDDPIAKQNYEQLIAQQQKEVESLSKVSQDDFVNKYKENPIEFTKNTYMDEFYRGLGSRFAYSRTERSITPNYAAIANLKLEQSERFHKDQMDLEYYKEGVKLVNGELKKADKDKSPLTQFSTLPPNTQNPNDIPTGEAALKLKNDDLTNQNTQIVSDFLSSWANANPDIRNVLQSSNSASGTVTTVKGFDILENNNNQPGLQIEDLNLPVGSVSYNKAVKAGLKPEQLKIYNDLYLSYDQIATGIDRGIKDLPTGLADVVERKQLNDAAINANNAKVDAINTALSNKFGISKEDIDFYNNYSVVQSFKDGPYKYKNRDRWLNIYSKITDNDAYEKERNALYAQIENRVQFEQPILKDNEDAQKLFGEILYSQGTEDNSISAQTIAANTKSIEVIRAGRSQNGTGYTMTANITTKEKEGEVTKQYTVRLTPQQALQLGFNQSPYSPINDEVNIQGYSSPKLISAQVNPNIPNRTPLRAKIVVYRINPNSNSDFSSAAYLVGPNGEKTAYIPGSKRERPDEAYVAAKGALQTAENYGFTREQMIDFFIQNKNK